MKKVLCMLMLLAVSAFICGCRPLVEEDSDIDLYAGFYPIYALLDGLTEDVPGMNLHCLVQPQDGCLRDYELSDWDLYLLASDADAVFIGGRGLESFEGTLFAWGDQGPAVSAVLYNLDLYNQEDTDVSDEDASHLDGPNPHLYMSVHGTEAILESMYASLVSLDPKYAAIYETNLENTLDRMEALCDEVSRIRSEIAGNSVIVMNEALMYIAEDYGLEIAHAVDRESGVALYDKELEDCLEAISTADSNTILIEKQAPKAFVTALEEAGYSIVRIDIFSDHTMSSDAFSDYIATQMKNAAVIRSAFNE